MGRTLYSFGLVLAVGLFFLAHYQVRVPRPQPPLTGVVDYILVDKSARRMQVYREGALLKSYPIALGFSPEGDKEREGDGRTPEGIYKIDRKNPNSQFYLSLGLNYPLAEDKERARKGGYDPGGDIFIHGQPNLLGKASFIARDWTLGCIAVSNGAMDELFPAISIGTVIEIRR